MFATRSPYHAARRNQRRSTMPASTSTLAVMSDYTRAPRSRSPASIATALTDNARTPRAASPASTLTTISDDARTPRATSPAPSYRTVVSQQSVHPRSTSPAPSYRTTDPRLLDSELSPLEANIYNEYGSISEDSYQENASTGIFSNMFGSISALRTRYTTEKLSREFLVAVAAGKLSKVESMIINNPSIREALLSNGVPSQRSGMVFTPLQMTAVRGHLQVAMLLLEHGADIDGRGTGGSNALCSALSFQRNAMVRLLLDHGADVNVRNGPTNRTPLMGAAMQGQQDMVQLLLQHGADIDAVDDTGRTALGYARLTNRVEVIRMLEEAGSSDVQAPPSYSGADVTYYR